ncbi:energy-coupling factor transporter transmembrane component T family protein [Roseinatronobacter sp.]
MSDPALSPRARLVIALVLAFGIAAIKGLAVLALAVCLAAGVALASGQARLVLRRLRGVAVLASGLLLALSLIVGESVLARVGPLALRQEGLEAGVLIAVRLLSIVALTLALLAPLSPFQLVGALRGLRAPALMADLALLTLRYLDEVSGELRRAHLARRLRGGRTGWRTLREHAGVLATGLIRAQARSERVWAAMRLRGYNSGLAMPVAPLRAMDWVCMGGALLAALGIIWLDRIF